MKKTLSEYYQKNQKRKLKLTLFLFSLLIFCLLLDLSTGPGNLSFVQVGKTLFTPSSASKQLELIIWEIRLPIALMAVLVGASLAVAGAQMQTILSNPLAEPFTLGISYAASFGAAISLIYGGELYENHISTSLSAFIFSLLATALLLLFAQFRNASSQTMILVGIALLFSFNALLSLVQYGASDGQVSQIVFWMMGSLGRSDWNSVMICALALALCLPIFIVRNWALTAMRMGDERALSLGFNVKRIRIEILIAVSLLTATAVAFTGTIAFVGLVGPHIARILVGEEQRFFMPLSMICGALLMSATSVVSKSITPGMVYPVGIITSLIGIPFFLSLIIKSQKPRLS